MKKCLFLFCIIMILLLVGCETPHTHEFIEGVCGCGEVDPNYQVHTHNYVEGICACGEVDPNYHKHEHNFIEGICECGEADPNYQKHEHNFIEGVCECGEADSNYQKHEHAFDFGGFCVYCGEMYIHEHEYLNDVCSCGLKEGDNIPEVKNLIPGLKETDIIKYDFFSGKEIEYLVMQRNSFEARSYVFKKDNDFIDYLINCLDIEYVNYDLLSEYNLNYYDDIARVGSDEEYCFTIIYTDGTWASFFVYSNGNVELSLFSYSDITLVSLSLINFYEVKKMSNEKFVWGA